VVFQIDPDQAEGGQLSQDALPLTVVQVGAHPEHAELVVAAPAGFLRRASDEDVDHVTSAERLAATVDGREREARVVGAVDQRDRLEAGVAVAAGLDRFVEVLEHDLPAAPRGLAVAEQGFQLLLLDPPDTVGSGGLLHQAPQERDVLEAVDHVGVGRQSVASRAPGLLIVRLE
jgi:hypothetical protein